jgi:two-component system cell cycle response regulator
MPTAPSTDRVDRFALKVRPYRPSLNFRPTRVDLPVMSKTAHSDVDLVPLEERMRMIFAFRACAVVLILVAWLTVPVTRGTSFPVLAGVSVGYLAVTYVIEAMRRSSRRRWKYLFGVFAMTDSVFLAWASFGTAGLASPLRYLILLQIITVCLLASFKTGLKLAVFNAWLLLCAVYAAEAHALKALGGDRLPFGSAGFRVVAVDVSVYFLVALVTTTFAAINERELRRRRYDMEALARFALSLEGASDPEGVAKCLLDGVAEIYECSPGTVVLRDDGILQELASLELTDGLESPNGPPRPVLSLERDSPILERTIQTDAPLLVARAGMQKDEVLARFPKDANVAIVPLRGDKKGVVGVMVVQQPARRGSRMERRVLSTIERFASHASLALANAYLLEEVKALAITDPLTGLSNRRHLDNVLEKACLQVSRGHGTLGLMMVDIDHFKNLNDTYGHQVGDDVLKLVAKALDEDLRTGDLAARYGGEEFSIVMPEAQGAAVEQAAERLRAAIARLPTEVPVTISVGVAWAPEHGTTTEELTRAADSALYSAKRAGRNQVGVAGMTRAAGAEHR